MARTTSISNEFYAPKVFEQLKFDCMWRLVLSLYSPFPPSFDASGKPCFVAYQDDGNMIVKRLCAIKYRGHDLNLPPEGFESGTS